MPKYDGLTLRLSYQNGHLVSGSTRGDGMVGEDVTHNLPGIGNIPKNIPFKNDVSIFGEVYIIYQNLAYLQDKFVGTTGVEYSNPRNFASGSSRLLYPRETQKRLLEFSAFGLYGMNFKTKKEEMNCLHQSRFTTIFQMVSSEDLSLLKESIQQIASLANHPDIPIDGIVFFCE